MTDDVTDLTPVCFRNLVWDSNRCEDAEYVARLVGLVPSSEEVADAEHRQAHARFNQLQPIMPLVVILTEMQAKIMAARETGSDVTDMADADIEPYRQIARSILVSGVSALVDLGVVTITGGVVR